MSTQRIFLYAAIASWGPIVHSIGGELNPLQRATVHQRTGVGSAGGLLPVGSELHTDGFHLFLKIEILEVGHAYGIERVAEVAQPFDVDGLSLFHLGVHHGGDVAQHGLHVGVTDGGDASQFLGYVFGSTGLPLTMAWG